MKKKSIIKNYIYNLTYQLLTIILPVVTTPYLSRVFGAENIGIYSYTISIVTYFILFGSLGVAMYGQREIAYVQDNKQEMSKTFYEIVIMRFITLSISMLFFYILFASHGNYAMYYRILLLEILANAFDISWFYQGIEDFQKTALRHILIKLLSIISVFIFVKGPEDLKIYFFIYVTTTLVGNLSLWLYLPKNINKLSIKSINIFRHFKPTLALFIPQIAIQVYTILDKTMIGAILKDMAEVGNYEQSQKIIKIALTIVTSLINVLIPRIANTYAKKDNKKVIKYLEDSFHVVWLLGVPIMFGIMAISFKFVPWFFGKGFEKAKILLIVGSPVILSIGLNSITGVQYLVSTKKQNIFTKSVVIGAIFNTLFNLIFIYYFKSVGATIVSVFAETLILLVQIHYVKKDIPMNIVYKDALKSIIGGVIMFGIVFAVGVFLKANIFTTFLQILIGTLVYFGIMILFKDEFLIKIIDKVGRKLKHR